MEQLPPIPVKIRQFEPTDAEICRHLYQEGPINGHNAPNDTGLDMEDIQSFYMSSPGGKFWVAENDGGEVVGMIGVQTYESGEGEIRRLRVRSDHRRRGIGTRLLETAIRYCKDMQHLRVTLDTFMDREPAMKLFDKFRFRLSRERQVTGKTLLYFYLDLYSNDGPPPKPKL